jgi:hypothetical protein
MMLFGLVAPSDPALWNGSADGDRTEMMDDDSASTDVVEDEVTFMT